MFNYKENVLDASFHELFVNLLTRDKSLCRFSEE